VPFANINGISVNYQIQGQGPALLMFAPGGWRSVMSRWTAAAGKEAWKEMDGLATLSKHFTTIAYDRRESGLSGGRVEALSWDLYVKEAHALLDLAGFKSAYILGCCMGASLATALPPGILRLVKVFCCIGQSVVFCGSVKARPFFNGTLILSKRRACKPLSIVLQKEKIFGSILKSVLGAHLLYTTPNLHNPC